MTTWVVKVPTSFLDTGGPIFLFAHSDDPLSNAGAAGESKMHYEAIVLGKRVDLQCQCGVFGVALPHPGSEVPEHSRARTNVGSAPYLLPDRQAGLSVPSN